MVRRQISILRRHCADKLGKEVLMGVLSGIVKNDVVDETVEIYRVMIESIRKVQGGDNNEKIRFFKLEVKANKLFSDLTNDQKFIAATKLVESGHMNPKIIDILKTGGMIKGV